jgi:enterochelin esterase family protein
MTRNPTTVRAGAVMLLAALAVAGLLLSTHAVTQWLFPEPPALDEVPRLPSAVVSPEVRPDRTVAFRLYAPRADRVLLVDETNGLHRDLVRDDRGVWSVTVGPLEPEVYRYLFHVDGVPTPDPNNAWVKPGRGAIQNLVEVPGDTPHAQRPVPHGVLNIHRYESGALGGKPRGLVVYTPPGYDRAPARRYPVLYLLHGTGDDETCWTNIGLAHRILDNLLADGRAVPMIVVMPDGHAADPTAGIRAVEMRAFGADLWGEIIPLVERTYRTLPGPEGRAIAGLSMGGGQAFAVAATRPDLFASVGLFSMARGNVLDLAERLNPSEANDRLTLFWVGCGRQDDVHYEVSEGLHDELAARGIHHVWHPTDGGHNWVVWRKYLAEFVPLLFRS